MPLRLLPVPAPRVPLPSPAHSQESWDRMLWETLLLLAPQGGGRGCGAKRHGLPLPTGVLPCDPIYVGPGVTPVLGHLWWEGSWQGVGPTRMGAGVGADPGAPSMPASPSPCPLLHLCPAWAPPPPLCASLAWSWSLPFCLSLSLSRPSTSCSARAPAGLAGASLCGVMSLVQSVEWGAPPRSPASSR